MLCAIRRQNCVTSHPKTHVAGHQVQCCPHCTNRSVIKVYIIRFSFLSFSAQWRISRSRPQSAATPTRPTRYVKNNVMMNEKSFRALTQEFQLKSRRFFQLLVSINCFSKTFPSAVQHLLSRHILDSMHPHPEIS